MTGAIAAPSVVVYDDGTLRISRIRPPSYGLVLEGEADETGYEPLVAALAQLGAGNGAGRIEVHLDLSGLRYCDAAALHAMIAAAEDGSRNVVLYHPAAQLRALIRIAGWDELRTLKLVTAP